MFNTLGKRLEALETKAGGSGPVVSIRFVRAADGQVVPFRSISARDGRTWEMREGESEAELLERARADAERSGKATMLLCMDPAPQSGAGVFPAPKKA